MPKLSADHTNVLVIASGHVGNNIFCTPAIRFLKRTFPNTRIDVVATTRRGADVFRGNPDVAGVRRVFFKRSVRRIVHRYDFAIGLYTNIARACLRGARIPVAIIAPGGGGGPGHRADYRLDFVQSLTGLPIDAGDRRYTLHHEPGDAETASRLVSGATRNDFLIGLHLGCGRTASHGWKFWYARRDQAPRLWPVARYIDLARQIQSVEPRARFVVTGSRNERFLANEFAAAVPDTIDLVGRTTLQNLAALMGRLRLVVTQDTGILHVASATDVPIVGLFGPTSPDRAGPYPPQPDRVVIKRDGMSDITPRDALPAVLQQLSRTLGALALSTSAAFEPLAALI